MNRPGSPNSNAQSRVTADSPVSKLRRAWQEGPAPELASFIASLGNLSPGDLAALIQVDFDARWSRNDRVRAEEYLCRFSAIAVDPELAVDVIYGEYLAREQSGEQPQLAEYESRFPEFAHVLSDQIRLHHAFDMLDVDPHLELSDDCETGGISIRSPHVVSEAEANYEILEQIGSGGMGVVYKARQPALNRFVAIKMVRAIDAGNRELLARFRAEAHVVASLHHPHIVQVYDYGEHDGLPYLAMELVEGGSLADRAQGTRWEPKTAAALLIKLADAVHYAHQCHVIHRDLKPANVLVASEANELEVKITDFGLAKLLAEDSSPRTKSYAFLGTPSYMAPEQANGRAREIGPAADVYSLGAILCELLTGRPPLRGETAIDTLRLLLSSEPASVNQLASGLPRDLTTICDKCLQGAPNRRYASAAELRDELCRYLDGRPIHARPVSGVERAQRWCRRNPLLAAALGLVAILLVTIVVVSMTNSARLRLELSRTQEMGQAERAANFSAQSRLWDSYLSEAAARNGSHRVGQRFAALELVDKAAALLDILGRTPERQLALRTAVLASVAVPDMRETRSLVLPHVASWLCEVSIPADLLVLGTEQGVIAGYRFSNGEKLWRFEGVSPSARARVSGNGQLLALSDDQGVRVFSLVGGTPEKRWHAAGVEHFTFAPECSLAAYSLRDQGMRLVRADTGEIVRSLGKGAALSDFAFDPHSGRIAVSGNDGVQIIAGDTGALEQELPQGKIGKPLIVWSPAGELLATWTDSPGIELWDVESRKKVHLFPNRGPPARLVFSADGSMLIAETLWNQRLVAWDVGTTQQILEVVNFANCATWASPAGGLMFLTLKSNGLKVAELVPGARHELAQSLDEPLGYWGKVAVSPDGRIVAFSSQQCLELWDARSLRRLWARAFGSCEANFDSAGRLVVSCEQGLFRLARNLETLEDPEKSDHALKTRHVRTRVHFGAIEQLAESVVPWTVSISASGKMIALQKASNGSWMILGTSEDRKSISIEPEGDPRKSSVSDDKRYMAVCGWERGGAEVWSGQSGDRLAKLNCGRHGVPLFSPDGKYLVTSPDGITVWRTGEWKALRGLSAVGTTPTGLGIAFSPDSRVLAVGDVGGAISLLDPETGTEWAKLSDRLMAIATIMAFSPDQRRLITSSYNENAPAQVWDLAAMRDALKSRNLDWPAEVLQPGASESYVEGTIEIAIEDDGRFSKKPE